MNEETKNVPPAPAAKTEYPYAQWWQEGCREIESLKVKLANAETMLTLTLNEIRRLKAGGK